MSLGVKSPYKYTPTRTFNGTSDFASTAIDLSAETKITLTLGLFRNVYEGGNTMAAEFTTNAVTQAGAFEFNSDWTGGTKSLFLLNSSSGNYLGKSCPDPQVFTFNHWIIEYDRPNSAINVWINNVAQTMTTEGGGGVFNPATNFANSTLYLMSRAGTGLFVPGRMAPVGVYGSAVTLTAAERAALATYQIPAQVRSDGLLKQVLF